MQPKKYSKRAMDSDSAIDYSCSPFEFEPVPAYSLQLESVETSVPCVCKESQIPPVVFDFHGYFVSWEDSGQKTRIRVLLNQFEKLQTYTTCTVAT